MQACRHADIKTVDMLIFPHVHCTHVDRPYGIPGLGGCLFRHGHGVHEAWSGGQYRKPLSRLQAPSTFFPFSLDPCFCPAGAETLGQEYVGATLVQATGGGKLVPLSSPRRAALVLTTVLLLYTNKVGRCQQTRLGGPSQGPPQCCKGGGRGATWRLWPKDCAPGSL